MYYLTEVLFSQTLWTHEGIISLISCMCSMSTLLFVLWSSSKRWEGWGMENWFRCHTAGKASEWRGPDVLFILCTPTKCSHEYSLSLPYSCSNFSLPTWLCSSLCGNLCGCFAARQVYTLIIANVELHKLGKQTIKYQTDIPKQDELLIVEITMVIKEEFCNYKNALTMKRK